MDGLLAMEAISKIIKLVRPSLNPSGLEVNKCSTALGVANPRSGQPRCGDEHVRLARLSHKQLRFGEHRCNSCPRNHLATSIAIGE